MPIYVKVSEVASCGTDIEYLPSMSVKVPMVEPVTTTETPITAPSLKEVTVPVITLVCDTAKLPNHIKNVISRKNFFINLV